MNNLQVISQQYYDYWFQLIIEFTKTDFFHQFGLVIVVIVASMPAPIPIPNEVVMLPLYLSGVNPIYIVLAVGFGGFVGDAGLFFFGSKILRKITKGRHDRVIEASHWIHRHGVIVYIISPSLFFGIGDLVMIISGHQGVQFSKIAVFDFLGNIIRGVWGMAIVMGLISIPNFLQF